MPKANPTLEGNIDNVFVWYVEYDISGSYTNREIGMDAEGNVVFKAPYEDNLGYWVDNDLTLENYRSFNPVSVSAKEFETLSGGFFLLCLVTILGRRILGWI